MKALVLLFCLAQLWGCHSFPHGLGPVYRELTCDDPETEQAALVAVDYINSQLRQGYKHALNQIDKVKVSPRQPTGEWFDLEIDTLETTCHVLDPTPLANCSVRLLTEHAVEGDCNVRLLKQDGQFSVQAVRCKSSPDSAEDVRKVCLDCPLLAPLNDTRVVHAAEAALAAFNAQSNGAYYQLVEISRAQLVLLPVSVRVEFAVAATDCVAKEVIDPAKCNLLAEKQYGFCKATLTVKVGGEDVAVTCTLFQTQPVVLQPQPDGTKVGVPTIVAEPAVPSPPAASLPVAALVVGPVVVAAQQLPPPGHRAHYDLRHALTGVGSVESASGEAFFVDKTPRVVQPGIAASASPVVRPCPGRIRYFKI
ncbi:PREDICTED: alpha-2-HS-glycoprotein [Ceratotherium simum simum]|uniref:Alpha-2-HS-glycoprotein n=1 Tax=Ceratotherium simum simum TaxID=73337 RepID=A0ABM0HDA7_CERSS|nr:PREDICTED: alpha-2-HS-glycoprotein [Ceratotherium simum simum]